MVKKAHMGKEMSGGCFNEQDSVNKLSKVVIGAAIEVHQALGPGLLESAYQQCLKHELNLRGLSVRSEVELAVSYKGMALDCGYRIDFIVGGSLLLELKSVRKIEAIHEAQILTYLKLAKIKTGLLMNFNVPVLKDGIKRFVN